MNETMMNRSRAIWTKEEESAEGKDTFATLPPETQMFLIRWDTMNKAYLILEAAKAERDMMYTLGFTAETYDFTDIHNHIIKQEDRYQECKKRYDAIAHVHPANGPKIHK